MLSVIPEDQSKDAWIATFWKQEWEEFGPTRVHRHISEPREGVKGEICVENMKTCGLADSAACEYGEP